jgi:hypothetical protein
MTSRQVSFKVPTDVDTFQDNYIGLIIHEINRAKVSMKGSIDSAYSDILSTVQTEMTASLAAAETAINTKIETDIAKVVGGAVDTEGTVVTQVKNYVDDQLAEFEKHVTESLATKANIVTTDALDEFFKVVDSAMEFSGSNSTYNPPA